MTGKSAVAARERARLAKIERYADRAAREARIEDAVTEFYLAADAYEAALAAAATARAAMAGQVATLIGELKEPVSGAAVLCGITAAQVRALRKEATTAAGDANTAATEAGDGQVPDPAEHSIPSETGHAGSTPSSGAGTGGSLEQNGDHEEREDAEPAAADEQTRAS